jgi:hypothetical protein
MQKLVYAPLHNFTRRQSEAKATYFQLQPTYSLSHNIEASLDMASRLFTPQVRTLGIPIDSILLTTSAFCACSNWCCYGRRDSSFPKDDIARRVFKYPTGNRTCIISSIDVNNMERRANPSTMISNPNRPLRRKQALDPTHPQPRPSPQLQLLPIDSLYK